MTRERPAVTVSPGAILLYSVAFFFDATGYTSALLPAIAVHELGHAAALMLCGAAVCGVKVGVLGLSMDYTGVLSRWQEAVSAIAGPLAGALYALIACRLPGEFFPMSGRISTVLTAFNLLPVRPLDGGRLVSAALGERAGKACSRAFSLLTAALAVYGLVRWRSVMLIPVSLWLISCNF